MSKDKNKVATASISWEHDIPASNDYDDVYFSLLDGLQESQYVFVDANELPARFSTKCMSAAGNHEPLIIAEAGFGAGVNFLNTWKNWQNIASEERRQLHFISFEKHPLSRSDLEKSLSKWPELANLSQQLRRSYPILIKGHHTLRFESGNIILSLVFGDIIEMLPNYSFKADCWYLDGFSPNKNPEMWSTDLFSQMARLSKIGTTFSTYAAASSVRKGLESVGFTVNRRKGFGKKREMLIGAINNDLTHPSEFSAKDSNWSRPTYFTNRFTTDQTEQKSTAVVIGAGLAGCSTAVALCKRGINVTLLDEKCSPVGGASGQSQLVMYAKFPSERNKLFGFIEHSLSHGLQFYEHLQNQANKSKAETSFWNPCGLLQLAWNEKEANKQARFERNIEYPTSFIRTIDSSEASSITGIDQECGGLWFERAGWLNPKQYAEHILDTSINQYKGSLNFCPGVNVISIEQTEKGLWAVQTPSHKVECDYVVVCNSNDARKIDQLSHLPIKPLRGQVTSIKERSHRIPDAQCVITGEGYLCPPLEGWHHFGATFNLDSVDTSTNSTDDEKNFDSIQQWNPNWLSDASGSQRKLLDYEKKNSAGLRCTTPDYLPIVGQAPIFSSMVEKFAKLRVGANSCKHLHGDYYPGLYVNIGHGSKGAFTTPIAAEFIASEIAGGISPLNEEHRVMLSASRFIIKHLKQRRI